MSREKERVVHIEGDGGKEEVLGALLQEMDEESDGGSRGSSSNNKAHEDEDDDDSTTSSDGGDDFEDEIEDVFNSHIEDTTRDNYILSQVRLVLFLARSNTEKGSRKHRQVLAESLRHQLKLLDEKRAPLSEKREFLKATMKAASKENKPIIVEGEHAITPEIFFSFLLSISDTKKG